MPTKCKVRFCDYVPPEYIAYEYVDWKFKGDRADEFDRGLWKAVAGMDDIDERLDAVERYLRIHGFKMIKIKDSKSDELELVEKWERQ